MRQFEECVTPCACSLPSVLFSYQGVAGRLSCCPWCSLRNGFILSKDLLLSLCMKKFEKFFFSLSKCIRRSTSVDEGKGFFWFVLAVQGWRWGPPVPLSSAVCWILNSTLSVPGFVFNIVQLQEGVQSIAATSFIGSGNKPEEIPSFSLITVLGFYWLGFLTHPTLR